MHIELQRHDKHAVLLLRGEFDTYYVRALQDEIDALAQDGMVHIVLNLRLVKFINSTALGAIIKASKALAASGGRLVLSRPSSFVREIVEKVGLDRVVPIFDSDEAAAEGLFGEAQVAGGGDRDVPENDDSSVLFTPTDPERIQHYLGEAQQGSSKVTNPVHKHEFGKNWRGVGRMSSVDESGVRFTWSGGNSGMDAFAMGQFLAVGTDLKIKFRLPLFKKGWCEAVACVTDCEERSDGVKIGASFKDIDEKTLAQVRQNDADNRYLKDELYKATGD